MRHKTVVCVLALAVTGAAVSRSLPSPHLPGPPPGPSRSPRPDGVHVSKGAVQAGSTGTTSSAGLAATVDGGGSGPPQIFDPTALTRTVRGYLARRPGKAGVMVSDLRTGTSFGTNSEAMFVAASVMKVNILAGLLLQRQGERRGLSRGERALASDMIRYSHNGAAHTLYASAGQGPGIARVNPLLDLKQTRPYPVAWGASMTSPADQVRLLGTLTNPGGPLNEANRRYVLQLMSSVVGEQRWGISAAARPGEKVAIKNGWTPLRVQGHGWEVNSVGRVTGPEHDFLVAVFSTGHPTMRSGVRTVEHLADVVVSAMRRAATGTLDKR